METLLVAMNTLSFCCQKILGSGCVRFLRWVLFAGIETQKRTARVPIFAPGVFEALVNTEECSC